MLAVAGALGAGATGVGAAGALGAGGTLATFGGSGGGSAFANSSVAARKLAVASVKDALAYIALPWRSVSAPRAKSGASADARCFAVTICARAVSAAVRCSPLT